MSDGKKRRNDTNRSEIQSNKKNKTKSFWSKSVKNYQTITGIETATQGIFATCDRGREAKCVAELYELLEECASKLYDLEPKDEGPRSDSSDEEGEDIEALIKREISSLKGNKTKKLFLNIKLDLQCVVFFRTKAPCIPTEIVHALLEGKAQSKWVHRLTPVTQTGKATVEGIEEVAKAVLGPHFHEGQDGVKFAIRPTTRFHNVLNRDQVIKIVADIVGPKHKVDLKNYDVLILVEIFKNMCGMSVVRDFEKLKRYNLNEVLKNANASNSRGPTVKDQISQETAKARGGEGV